MRWFDHVLRRIPNVPLYKCEIMMIGSIKKGMKYTYNHVKELV